MPIISLAFEDLDSGWKLEETRFDALNLLVGPSGIGKTRILGALLNLRSLSLGMPGPWASCRWSLEIASGTSTYGWKVEIESTRSRSKKPSGSPETKAEQENPSHRFVTEQIVKDGDFLVRRNRDEFVYNDGKLPKLRPSESAVTLLGNEELIQPLRTSLLRIHDVEDLNYPPSDWMRKVEADYQRSKLSSQLSNSETLVPLLLVAKLYILKKDHAEVFDRIALQFREIFPTVEALTVGTVLELDIPGSWEYQTDTLIYAIKERGVSDWIPQYALSAGMLKTLNLLTEIELAPRDSVFLIDELENSLGANCLPEVASLMLRGLDTRQFIATSHHPRVINEIPFRHWKLVTRQGSTVRVLDAVDIPALRDAPSLERFTELLSLPQFSEPAA